jgi:hypothetical protein
MKSMNATESHMTLAQRFSYNGLRKLDGSRPLNEIEMREVAPSIFAAEKHESRSERYAYIPTIEVLRELQKRDFQPFMVCQSTSRVPGKSDFTKHMIRLRHPEHIGKGGAAEVILLNSHDGTSAYQMLAGYWEMVCQNGLMVGKTYQDVRVRHSGKAIEEVVEGAHEVLRTLQVVEESRDHMKQIGVNRDMQMAFAKAALELRYDEDEFGNSKAPIQPERLLTVHRQDETRDFNTLWRTFNVVQENTIRGGLRGRTADNRRTRTREVKGIDQANKLNRALWTLADEMTKILAKAA